MTQDRAEERGTEQTGSEKANQRLLGKFGLLAKVEDMHNGGVKLHITDV